MIERADDQLSNFLRVGEFHLALVEFPLHLPVIFTGAPHFVPPLLLQERPGPLDELAAPMVLGVPRAGIDLDLFLGWIFLQVLADVDGSEAKRARAEPIQDGPVEESPEAALNVRAAEPAADRKSTRLNSSHLGI